MSSQGKIISHGASNSHGGSKQEKLKYAVELLPKSAIVHKIMPSSRADWAGILAELDEDKLDGFLDLLGQEEETFLANQSEEELEESLNEKGDYIDKLEDLRISMEEISHNVSGDA